MRPFRRTPVYDVAAHRVDVVSAVRPLSGRTVRLSLLAFFGVVIGVNAVMATLAVVTMPGLENQKPYQAGIGYNAEIGAARAQAALRWNVASHIGRDAGGRTALTVEAHDGDGAPLTQLAVTVRLLRPTDQRADRTISLIEHKGGSYVGEAADIAPGVWDVELDAGRGPERMFRSRNRVILE